MERNIYREIIEEERTEWEVTSEVRDPSEGEKDYLAKYRDIHFRNLRTCCCF